MLTLEPHAARAPPADITRVALGIVVLAIAAAVLAGWALDIDSLKTVLPGLVTMKVNTAIGLAAGAACLCWSTAATPWRRHVATAGAVLIGVIGALTLFEYLADAQLGVDQLLVTDPLPAGTRFNGRASPATAIAFVAAGASLTLLRLTRGRRAALAAHLLAAIPAGVGFLSLAGYAYGVEGLYNFGRHVSVALHSAAALCMIAAGIALLRRDDGWRYRLVGRPIAHATFTHIAVLAAVVPFATGLLVIGGMRAGYYQPEFAPSLCAVAAAAALLWTAWSAARRLAGAERDLRSASAQAQRRAEELAASRFRHQALLEGLPQLVWTALADGRCNYFSRQWLDYTGLPEADQLGFGWLDLTIHPHDVERTRRHWQDSVSRERPYDIEYRIRGVDGAYRWFKALGAYMQEDARAQGYWFGTCTDIEDIVAARECLTRSAQDLEAQVTARTGELMATEAQLRQLQKIEAVGQLTSGIAHDFNNLLTGIMGNLELLQTRPGQGRLGDLDRHVEAAWGAAQRAASLTHRLLAFSRAETLDPKPINANRLTAGMEDLVRRTAGPQIAVEVAPAADLWTILVDPGQLENALLNLCINARDAISGSGRLVIETANRWLDHTAARLRELPPGPYVTLCVSDTGAGMTPEVIARAFDPFFTTKPSGHGTGLGLSMVYGFARQSGGRARIYSEPGQGTTVCLYLPRHDGAELSHPIASKRLLLCKAAGETVLVIDDETTVRTLVTEVLQDSGYTAIEAADGPTGLKLLQSDMPIDLLVTDVGLPGSLNGRQVADAARLLRPHLKVLFITGYSETAVLDYGTLEPDMHIMSKPFGIDALTTRVREIIAGE